MATTTRIWSHFAKLHGSSGTAITLDVSRRGPIDGYRGTCQQQQCHCTRSGLWYRRSSVVELSVCCLARFRHWRRTFTSFSDGHILYANLEESNDEPIRFCLLVCSHASSKATYLCGGMLSFNPQLVDSTLPISLARLVRGSSTTAMVTEYLRSACRDIWPGTQVGPSIDWPEDFLACEGSAGMIACIQNTPDAIGYLDIATVAELPIQWTDISLLTVDGTFLTCSQAMAQNVVAAAALSALPKIFHHLQTGISLRWLISQTPGPWYK